MGFGKWGDGRVGEVERKQRADGDVSEKEVKLKHKRERGLAFPLYFTIYGFKLNSNGSVWEKKPHAILK